MDKQNEIRGGVNIIDTPIIGYKKVLCECKRKDNFDGLPEIIKGWAIAQLLIPEKSVVVKPNVSSDNKMRTDRAITNKIFIPENNNLLEEECDCECYSWYDNNYFYVVNREQKPVEKFDDDPTAQCTSGIHFFLTENEAVDYAERPTKYRNPFIDMPERKPF